MKEEKISIKTLIEHSLLVLLWIVLLVQASFNKEYEVALATYIVRIFSTVLFTGRLIYKCYGFYKQKNTDCHHES